jgi:hypothetical protein
MIDANYMYLRKLVSNTSSISKEWVSDCCLLPIQQFFSYIMARTSIGIYCFSAKPVALRGKTKDWLARNQNNVFEWSGKSIRW